MKESKIRKLLCIALVIFIGSTVVVLSSSNLKAATEPVELVTGITETEGIPDSFKASAKEQLILDVDFWDQKRDQIMFEGNEWRYINFTTDEMKGGKPQLLGDVVEMKTGARTSYNLTQDMFKQWYDTVPGKSVHIKGQLPLEKNVRNGITYYELDRTGTNNYFYALDEELFVGETGKATADAFSTKRTADGNVLKNHHWTMRAQTKFTFVGGEVFEFSGDDDVWVYVGTNPDEGKRILNLGGLHPQESGSVAFNPDGSITNTSYMNIPNFQPLHTDDRAGTGVAKTITDVLPNNGGPLEVGQTYYLTIFYAERHTNQSNFKMSTSLELDAYDVMKRGTLTDDGNYVDYEVEVRNDENYKPITIQKVADYMNLGEAYANSGGFVPFKETANGPGVQLQYAFVQSNGQAGTYRNAYVAGAANDATAFMLSRPIQLLGKSQAGERTNDASDIVIFRYQHVVTDEEKTHGEFYNKFSVRTLNDPSSDHAIISTGEVDIQMPRVQVYKEVAAYDESKRFVDHAFATTTENHPLSLLLGEKVLYKITLKNTKDASATVDFQDILNASDVGNNITGALLDADGTPLSLSITNGFTPIVVEKGRDVSFYYVSSPSVLGDEINTARIANVDDKTVVDPDHAEKSVYVKVDAPTFTLTKAVAAYNEKESPVNHQFTTFDNGNPIPNTAIGVPKGMKAIFRVDIINVSKLDGTVKVTDVYGVAGGQEDIGAKLVDALGGSIVMEHGELTIPAGKTTSLYYITDALDAAKDDRGTTYINTVTIENMTYPGDENNGEDSYTAQAQVTAKIQPALEVQKFVAQYDEHMELAEHVFGENLQLEHKSKAAYKILIQNVGQGEAEFTFAKDVLEGLAYGPNGKAVAMNAMKVYQNGQEIDLAEVSSFTVRSTTPITMYYVDDTELLGNVDAEAYRNSFAIETDHVVQEEDKQATVDFTVKAQASFDVHKQVALFSEDTPMEYADKVDANIGDTVIFKIEVTNTSDVDGRYNLIDVLNKQGIVSKLLNEDMQIAYPDGNAVNIAIATGASHTYFYKMDEIAYNNGEILNEVMVEDSDSENTVKDEAQVVVDPYLVYDVHYYVLDGDKFDEAKTVKVHVDQRFILYDQLELVAPMKKLDTGYNWKLHSVYFVEDGKEVAFKQDDGAIITHKNKLFNVYYEPQQKPTPLPSVDPPVMLPSIAPPVALPSVATGDKVNMGIFISMFGVAIIYLVARSNRKGKEE